MPRADRTASKRSKPSESEYAFMRFVKTWHRPDHGARSGRPPRSGLFRPSSGTRIFPSCHTQAGRAGGPQPRSSQSTFGRAALSWRCGSALGRGRASPEHGRRRRRRRVSACSVGDAGGLHGSADLDRLTGRPRAERRATWLRSMRAEAEGHVSQKVGITRLERIVMINVYVAVIALLAWFFIFAGSPLLR